ncbi:hypothetical protein K435DRAFT_804859 [Dendrothele bispora CBS 962.96]|uniref:Uncharacterized protein n=1 Tax=Dendrothele bispora (strain CBS 962.96) TaxID=1314807 RepID=A0A4S8LE94_DENBC|nr:hypothetical protein K435DRAFT_804859 [Dendrothele bispora CBS 962.96]
MQFLIILALSSIGRFSFNYNLEAHSVLDPKGRILEQLNQRRPMRKFEAAVRRKFEADTQTPMQGSKAEIMSALKSLHSPLSHYLSDAKKVLTQKISSTRVLMPRKTKPRPKLSAYGREKLTILRPALFKLHTVQDNPSVFQFGQNMYDLYLNRDPEDLKKYWTVEFTKRQLKKKRLKLGSMIGGFFYFLRWRKDPNPRFSYFVQNLDDGVEALEIIRRDKQWAREHGEDCSIKLKLSATNTAYILELIFHNEVSTLNKVYSGNLRCHSLLRPNGDKYLQIRWNDPPLSDRQTPFASYGAAMLRGWLVEFLTPTYLAARKDGETNLFLDEVTWAWLHRFPTDVVPGSPFRQLTKYKGDLEKLTDFIEQKFKAVSFDHEFETLKAHLLESFELNETRGTVRTISKEWSEELQYALSIYDREYPVTSKPLSYVSELLKDPKYTCFSRRSIGNKEWGYWIFPWTYRDEEPLSD